tara:strand:- start:10765 stop:11544 length:780 start_codon:yes stop_codon:yes gene_type:complete
MSKQLNIKKTRKHKGIHQTGGNKGKLKKGFKYSGKRLKSGLPQIIQVGGPINNNERLSKQLQDMILYTPKGRYNEWKRLIPSYKYQLANSRHKYTEEEIAEKEKYIRDNLKKLIQYEKEHHIANDSVEMLKLYNKNQLEEEIKEMIQKVEEIKNMIKEASDLITDTELTIQFNKVFKKNSEYKKNSRILKEAKQIREKKKQELEPLYDRLRIFLNRLRELKTQLNQQIIAKKKKKLVINVGGKVKNLEKRFKKLLTSCS